MEATSSAMNRVLAPFAQAGDARDRGRELLDQPDDVVLADHRSSRIIVAGSYVLFC